MTNKEKNPHATALGRIKTEKKAQASRENGKKGGRPKLDKNDIHKPSDNEIVVS